MPLDRAVAAAALGLALAAGAAACGGDPSGPDARPALSDSRHGEADVAFASDLVQHHAQALSMVDLTAGRPLDPEVQALAESIREAQTPQIEVMVDWLTDWGEEVPETMRDHTNAGHGGGSVAESMEGVEMDVPGAVTAVEMTALEAAPDEEFQALWLRMMVEHHTGAVEMAETERAEGRYRDAVELAESISESQQAQIEQMEALLGS